MDNLLTRAQASMALGGPPPPWKVVGQMSIEIPGGDEFHLETNRGHVNSWTRQRICDGVNLLPELVTEIEKLRAALINLVRAHNGYQHEMGPCICAAHEDAREALRTTSSAGDGIQGTTDNAK